MHLHIIFAAYHCGLHEVIRCRDEKKGVHHQGVQRSVGTQLGKQGDNRSGDIVYRGMGMQCCELIVAFDRFLGGLQSICHFEPFSGVKRQKNRLGGGLFFYRIAMR